ncbi:MAG: bifunctional 5,10-methylenetetrahydrofolate dehydrogenase/5,10-methenyltetrahydrofolate cyclohydrolase [Saprospiraceae bacterium]|nr:bifunctional 5,10-methylenetetrahydrofolate dehydrogenase/5,10-methenyltetrahydrofolate cyclohydrolase [Saprospiraceae bacterium]
MILLDGKKISSDIKTEIAEIVALFRKKGLRPPHLVTVSVGENAASQSYIRSKIKACEKVGFDSTNIKLDQNISESELLDVIEKLNVDPLVDGFIVQLPLPESIDEFKIISSIDPSKDVDGFHPVNLGKLLIGIDTFISATPMGILEMLKRYNIPTEGKDIAVLGRSNIVGKPIAVCLMQKTYPGDASVSVLHSRTKNLREKLRAADIVIAAIGKPHFVTSDMVGENAVVIDVGINSIPDAKNPGLTKLVGDVDFDNVAPKCSYITPVPGGVGLMTVAALLLNTLKAYKQRNGID